MYIIVFCLLKNTIRIPVMAKYYRNVYNWYILKYIHTDWRVFWMVNSCMNVKQWSLSVFIGTTEEK